MLARMMVLEKIPQAFDAYVPPRGINVSWHHDFVGKENDNQVVAFFTGTELATDESIICKEGDIKNEVENNRCFRLVKTIPKAEWANVIVGFDHGGEVVSMPKDHPKIDPNWRAVREFESEIDEDAFEKLNELKEKHTGGRVDTDPSKVRHVKNKDRSQIKKVKVPYVSFIDVIREEKD